MADKQDAPASLSAKQLKALGLLANGISATNVAEAVGVTRRTVYNWRQLPAFRAQLREAGDEVWQDTAAILKGMSEEAMSAISAYFSQGEEGSLEKAYFALRYVRDINRVHATNEAIVEERRLNDAIINAEAGAFGMNGKVHEYVIVNGEKRYKDW
jgi:Helix-turn-helix of insertion element transposase